MIYCSFWGAVYLGTPWFPYTYPMYSDLFNRVVDILMWSNMAGKSLVTIAQNWKIPARFDCWTVLLRLEVRRLQWDWYVHKDHQIVKYLYHSVSRNCLWNQAAFGSAMSGSRPAQLAQGTYAKHSIAHDPCFPCRNHRHHQGPASFLSSLQQIIWVRKQVI